MTFLFVQKRKYTKCFIECSDKKTIFVSHNIINMEIEGLINIEQMKKPLNEDELSVLEKESQEGNKNSSWRVAVHYFLIRKTIDDVVLKYIDLALGSDDNLTLYVLCEVFKNGFNEDNIHIEKSEDLYFKYMLKRKSFSSFYELLQIADNYPERQNKIIEAAENSNLYPIYNDLIKKISKFTQGDRSKTFTYIKTMSNIYDFFIKERRQRLAKPIALDDEERMTHYTNKTAIHSMLRLPSDIKDIDEYKGKYPVLRLYNTAYMNDPEEGLYLFDCDGLKDIVSYIEEERYFNTYLTSFSTHQIDNLTMWRLYGQDGKGISILLPQKDYRSIMPSLIDLFSGVFHSNQSDIDADEGNILLYEVSYNCSEIRMKISEKIDDLEKTIDSNGDSNNKEMKECLFRFFAKACDEIRYLFKNPQYQIEKEFRYLTFHKINSPSVKGDERDIPHLYVETPPDLFRKGTDIIIGPKAEDKIALKLDIEYRLKRYGFNDIKVSISKAKYK